MMDWYSRRWWLALILFLSLLYIFYLSFLSGLLDETQALHASVITERQKLLQIQKLSRLQPETGDGLQKPAAFLETLQDGLLRNGLVLNSVRMVDPNLADVVIQGDFMQFVQWMRGFIGQPSPVWVKHFRYHANHFEVQVVWLGGLAIPITTMTVMSKTHQSFCNELSALREPSFSVTTMRMVGYLQYGYKQAALLSLPTGQILSVMVGDVIGTEHLMVKEIKPNLVECDSGHVIQRVS